MCTVAAHVADAILISVYVRHRCFDVVVAGEKGMVHVDSTVQNDNPDRVPSRDVWQEPIIHTTNAVLPGHVGMLSS